MTNYAVDNEERVNALLAFSLGMMRGGNAAGLIEKYQDAIENITPYDMLKLEDIQLQMQITPQEIKKYLDKVINVFYKHLDNYQWEKPPEGSFLHTLMLENEALDHKLKQIKKVLLKKDYLQTRADLLQAFQELTAFISHYEKKENILFPFFENKVEKYRALQVMWSLHDDIRKKLKHVIKQLEDPGISYDQVKITIGECFFLMYGMIQKENLVLLPVSQEAFTEEDDMEMQRQSFEYQFPFIQAPKLKIDDNQKRVTVRPEQVIFNTDTGGLNFKQLQRIFQHLPVDITFVDQDDKVCFYSDTPERIFPRSPAIIGRAVQNCHPPESVHVVKEIVDAFRKGEKDSAKFWLELKGRFIYIQYLALRDTDGSYLGVLEVSQDVTEIRQLQGQQRLLNWSKA